MTIAGIRVVAATGGGDCAYPLVLLQTLSDGTLQAKACNTADSCAVINSPTTYSNGKWYDAALVRSGTTGGSGQTTSEQPV